MPIVRPTPPSFPSITSPIPNWITNAGSLGSIREENASSFSVQASDPFGGDIVYALQAGALPDGLALNTATGAIENSVGNVSEDTTYNFTIRATSDATSVYADRAFSILVLNNLAPVWSTPGGSVGMFENGDVVSIQLTATDPEGDTPVVYTVSSGSLPDGLSLSTSGLISGTVSGVAFSTDFSFIVSATDSRGDFTDRGFSIFITVISDWRNWGTTLDGDQYIIPTGNVAGADAQQFAVAVSPNEAVAYYRENISGNPIRAKAISISDTVLTGGTEITPPASTQFPMQYLYPGALGQAMSFNSRSATGPYTNATLFNASGTSLSVQASLAVGTGLGNSFFFSGAFKFSDELYFVSFGRSSQIRSVIFSTDGSTITNGPLYIDTQPRFINFTALNSNYGIGFSNGDAIYRIEMTSTTLTSGSFGTGIFLGAGGNNFTTKLTRLSSATSNNRMVAFWRDGATANVIARVFEVDDLTGDITLVGSEETVANDHATGGNFATQIAYSIDIVWLDENLLMFAYVDTSFDIVAKVIEIDEVTNVFTIHQTHSVMSNGSVIKPPVMLSLVDTNRVFVFNKQQSASLNGFYKILKI